MKSENFESIDLLRYFHYDYINRIEYAEIRDYLSDKELTPDPIDEITNTFRMTLREYAAYNQGATLKEVANFRYNGWPDTCRFCGNRIDLDSCDPAWYVDINYKSEFNDPKNAIDDHCYYEKVVANARFNDEPGKYRDVGVKHIYCSGKAKTKNINYEEEYAVIKVEELDPDPEQMSSIAEYDPINEILNISYKDNEYSSVLELKRFWMLTKKIVAGLKTIALSSLKDEEILYMSLTEDNELKLINIFIEEDCMLKTKNLEFPDVVDIKKIRLHKVPGKIYKKFSCVTPGNSMGACPRIYPRYNPDNKVLHIRLKNGKTHKYIGFGENAALVVNKYNELLGIWVKNIIFNPQRDLDDIFCYDGHVSGNDIDKVKEILDNGSDANIRTDYFWGDTAIFDAETAEMAELLISYGADVNIKNIFGLTPMHKFAHWGPIEVLETLIKHGGDVNIRDNYGQAPLHWITWPPNKDIAKLLIDNGASVNALDNRGWTPLHKAALWGNIEVAEILLKQGANIEAKSDKGYTPLFLAQDAGRDEMVDFLLGYKAD